MTKEIKYEVTMCPTWFVYFRYETLLPTHSSNKEWPILHTNYNNRARYSVYRLARRSWVHSVWLEYDWDSPNTLTFTKPAICFGSANWYHFQLTVLNEFTFIIRGALFGIAASSKLCLFNFFVKKRKIRYALTWQELVRRLHRPIAQSVTNDEYEDNDNRTI